MRSGWAVQPSRALSRNSSRADLEPLNANCELRIRKWPRGRELRARKSLLRFGVNFRAFFNELNNEDNLGLRRAAFCLTRFERVFKIAL